MSHPNRDAKRFFSVPGGALRDPRLMAIKPPACITQKTNQKPNCCDAPCGPVQRRGRETRAERGVPFQLIRSLTRFEWNTDLRMRPTELIEAVIALMNSRNLIGNELWDHVVRRQPQVGRCVQEMAVVGVDLGQSQHSDAGQMNGISRSQKDGTRQL